MYVSVLFVTHSFIGHCFRLISTGSKESDRLWYEEVMVMV